ncbi:MAG: Heme/hemopexin-binding protein, partial [Chlamydiae bacterium]|nr:Heme/hemopexin-binding protein [Chlamydiota bacterium]
MKKLALFFALALPFSLFANPQDPAVAHGKAEFAQKNAKHLQVTASDKAIINWKDFSISFDELTEFLQPGADSVVLNRVVGENLSKLMGKLEANGKVYLLNPNGLLVGTDAVINVNEFLASTLDIVNEKFLQNCCGHLLSGDSKAEIVNLGQINARDGSVFLIGYRVDNQGDIQAPNGQVALAAAQEVLLKPSGQDRVYIRHTLTGEKEDGIGVSNSGTISALEIQLKAEGNPYAKAINHQGKADALKVTEKGGRIFLDAEDGNVEVSGSLVAEGGEVRVLGENVYLSGEAEVNVSSQNGGGTVLIGGDYQGDNPNIKIAERVSIAENVKISADALENGDGGKVIAFANTSTQYAGQVTAQGGPKGGDGGFVEISGKNLGFYGKVNASSPLGKRGTLLLDPVDVEISTGTTTGTISCPFATLDGGVTPNVINNGDLESCLETGMGTDVEINTSSLGMTSDPGNPGTITIKADIDYNKDTSLTLIADQDIILEADVKIENNNNDTPGLTLIAGNDLIIDDSTSTVFPEIRFSGAINITVGNDICMGEKTEIKGNSGAPIVIEVGRDFKMDDNAEVNVNKADLTLIVGRNIETSNNDSINTVPNFEALGGGNIFIEAGCDWISTGSAFTSATNGNITIVVDNAPPNDFRPNEGPCGIKFGGDSAIRTTGQGRIRIYTACHTKNDFSTTIINFPDMQSDAFIGNAFEAAGTPFVNSNIEQWDTWFTDPGQPDPTAGDPFRVYYKCADGNGNGNGGPSNGFPPNGITTIAEEFAIIGGFDPLNFFVTSAAENLLQYDLCAFDNCCNFYNPPYMMGYDRIAYHCCKAAK